MKDKHLTTNQGVPVTDNQNSLTVGERGPVLLQDVHLIEGFKGGHNLQMSINKGTAAM